MVAFVRAVCAAAVLLALGAASHAEDAFPSKPVHVFVPYPPGGAVDIVARTLGDELAKRWNQSVVIENRPGAGGIVAEEALAHAPPDGYTLIVVAAGHALNSYFFAKLPYDPFKDFTPISLIGSSPNMLIVRADSEYKSVADVIAAAKAKPGQLSYGHAGTGTSPHLAGELFKAMAHIDIAAVPYKGGAPALADLAGGHIPLTFNNIPESMGLIEAHTLRPLGVTTAQRSPVLPDVPAIADTLPGYDTGVWWAFLAPAGLPPDVKQELAKDCAEVAQLPGVRDKFLKLGATPIGSSPEVLDQLIHDEYVKWGPIIKAAGIKPE
jgi:tripartite-type tricarboxylate transporter receptor subunit TctC